jgi:hypothetical protein
MAKSNGTGTPPVKNRPVHVIRFGGIKAAIWRNQTSAGPIHNVTLTRSYKDGDKWKESTSYGFDDLLTAAKCLDLAHTWIHEARDAEQAEDGQG